MFENLCFIILKGSRFISSLFLVNEKQGSTSLFLFPRVGGGLGAPGRNITSLLLVSYTTYDMEAMCQKPPKGKRTAVELIPSNLTIEC